MDSVFVEFNNNPAQRRVGDCAVRAVSVALDVDWERAFALMAVKGFEMGDVISSNSVWGNVLRDHGFKRYTIPNSCPDCYTAADFARAHPEGIYTLGFGGHVATIRDGRLYDSWNSENEVLQYYWTNREEEV